MSANIFSTKAPIEEVIFSTLCRDGTTIIRLTVCRAYEVPSFLSSFNTPSIDPALGIEPDELPTELILPR